MREERTTSESRAEPRVPDAAPVETRDQAGQNHEGVLSEEELDALQANQQHSNEHQEDCQAYDFRDPARILNGRLPGMDALNDSFTKAMEGTLQHFLRRAVLVQSGETTLSRQSDYLNTLPLPASVQSVPLPSHESSIFITLEGTLAYACVDAYFGGRGSDMPEDPEREFSASERRVTHLLTQQVLAELTSAWTPICALEFGSPQGVSLSAGGTGHEDQILVVTKFKVELQPGGGEFHLALPYSLLDRLRPLLNTGPRSTVSNQQWLSKLQQKAWRIPVEVYSLFQNVEITVGELMALQPGDFIPIPEQDRVTVMVDKLPLYVAEPGNSEGMAAAKIVSNIASAHGVTAAEL